MKILKGPDEKGSRYLRNEHSIIIVKHSTFAKLVGTRNISMNFEVDGGRSHHAQRCSHAAMQPFKY